MITYRHSMLCLSIFLLLSPFTTISQATQQKKANPIPENTVWAWADNVGSQHVILISRQSGAEWEEPVQISHNEGVNVVPSVTKTEDQDLFVVWSTLGNQQAQLHYRQFINGGWTEEKEYYTGLSSNTAPSVSIDRSGKIWLVWAGFNGVSDEIYYSTWNSDAFDTAKPLTTNDIPDIQPVLGMDETTGQPWVQWQQYSDKGYIELEATWDGSAWSAPVKITTPAATTETTTATGETTSVSRRAFTLKKIGSGRTTKENSRTAAMLSNTAGDIEIEIPAFIKYPESASIHIPGYAIQSVPVRSVTSIKK